jgi:hypothetical protein
VYQTTSSHVYEGVHNSLCCSTAWYLRGHQVESLTSGRQISTTPLVHLFSHAPQQITHMPNIRSQSPCPSKMANPCSTPPVTALHSTLLKLPNETLLQISQYLPNSVKHSDPQADLVNLMSTCKRLVPLAREALFYAPILDSSKVDHFLATLFKYPVLPSKMHSLTIETKKIRGACIGPNPIPALDAALLSKAISHIGTLNIDQNTKQQLTKWLNTGNEFDGPQTLLVLLLTMLPNLRELYLGGSILYNFPLQPLLTPSSAPSHIFDKISSHNASLSTLLSLFSRKITVLELPNDFRSRFYNDDRYAAACTTFPSSSLSYAHSSCRPNSYTTSIRQSLFRPRSKPSS